MATIQQRSQQQSQQSQETVQINPDLSILIDGQKQECSQKACQSKQGGATVQKVQTHDGKTQIQLWTKVRMQRSKMTESIVFLQRTLNQNTLFWKQITYSNINLLIEIFQLVSKNMHIYCFYLDGPARHDRRSADPGVRVSSSAQPCSWSVW